MSDEQLRAALRRAYSLGQTYWQQADSDSTADHRRSDKTAEKFIALVEETVAALGAQPVGREGWQIEDCPELNLSNYDSDDVARLNDWAVRADAEIARLTKPATPIGARDPVGFAQHLLSAAGAALGEGGKLK